MQTACKKKSIHLDIPLLQQQNAKKLYGTKDNTVHSTWDKFGTQGTKRLKNPTVTFEEPGAKAGYCTCLLHTTLTGRQSK